MSYTCASFSTLVSGNLQNSPAQLPPVRMKLAEVGEFHGSLQVFSLCSSPPTSEEHDYEKEGIEPGLERIDRRKEEERLSLQWPATIKGKGSEKSMQAARNQSILVKMNES